MNRSRSVLRSAACVDLGGRTARQTTHSDVVPLWTVVQSKQVGGPKGYRGYALLETLSGTKTSVARGYNSYSMRQVYSAGHNPLVIACRRP